jgi:ring-1,2-phenylacetyl-CoA epoxidase subunit PaaC
VRTSLDGPQKRAMAGRLLEMADDELILAHRDSEWTGHAPILEEDIAFANIAQDEMGHALVWYEIRRSLTGDNPDHLVFFRKPSEFRNVQMVELPKGDWAFSMVRQWMFDMWEAIHLESLKQSDFTAIADAAKKILKEETYHLRHTRAWVRRLGLGTGESNRRMQAAVDQLWPYSGQLTGPPAGYQLLVGQSLMPDLGRLAALWKEAVRAELANANLRVPGSELLSTDRGEHSQYIPALIEELQQVARLEAEARW